MSNPENPPAFPNVEPRDPQFSSAQPGMTLRDWFAGQALAGLAANSEFLDGAGRQADSLGIPHENALAMIVYKQADAMLAAREQKA